ncbi:hypothetical protein [Aminobacterium mobile]|uniref:hypothetical protein n=1 Tax=Aminobacterium mobile TaxID=81467 RepID=UPI0033152AF7
MSAKENVNKKYAILGLIVFVVVIAVGMVVMTRPDGTNTLSSKKDFVYVNQGYHGSQSEYPFRDLGQGEIETWIRIDSLVEIRKRLHQGDRADLNSIDNLFAEEEEEEALYKYYDPSFTTLNNTSYFPPYIPLKECYTDILRDISHAYRELKMPAEDINDIVRFQIYISKIKFECAPELQKKYDKMGYDILDMIKDTLVEFFYVREPREKNREK